eukprot:m.42276 g.42276  ORF g.42276 m.42276 type:complete len:62 (-) comp19052_c0_seq1:247-432(-)
MINQRHLNIEQLNDHPATPRNQLAFDSVSFYNHSISLAPHTITFTHTVNVLTHIVDESVHM